MDPSTNPSMNGTQHSNNQAYGFLNGIQPFGGSDNFQHGEDYSQFFDPALFETNTLGHGFSQQQPQQPQQPPQSSQPQQPMSQNFDADAPRQSNSPSLPQYNPPQQSYHQYSQPVYDSRQMSQPTYDPRFYPRPSASPVGYDGGYAFQPHINYGNQNYNPQHLNLPPRQSPTPTQNYPPRQQQPSPYVNIGPRPSQLSQVQNAELMRFGNFHDQNHQQSNHFVDPSMLTANQMMNTTNNTTSFQPQQTYMGAYFKPSSTVDPRSLHGMQTLQPVPQPSSSQTAQPAIQPKTGKASKTKAVKDPHAPKKLKSQAKQDASPGSKAEARDSEASDSESDSDDELLIENEDPPELTPDLLTVSAPTDVHGKALYHAVQAVWSPRNRSAPPEKIRSGIAGFGDTVRGLRDAWKAKNDSLRKAEIPGSPTAADAAKLKDEVAHYRQVVENVMARALLFGHPAIVKRLGENQFTMSALQSFMLDRFNAGDYDSSLVKEILKFVVKFETLDSEMLEMTKLAKVLQRFAKKAASEIKTLSQTVLDNAAAASAKKASTTEGYKADKPASPKVGGSPADSARKELVTGMKRTREGDSASQSEPKKLVKVIAQSSKPLALQNAERRKALEAAQAAKSGDKPAIATPAVHTAAKAKVAVAAPPKSAVFSLLTSASKKPGTSIAARAAAAAKDKPTPSTSSSLAATQPMKKENARKESPPRNGASGTAPKSTSSFLGLLADMEKKPEKEAKKEVEIPNETEEQKAQRLRKEARRKLRVSWKADAELVETRLFTHDPEEEIGRGDSLGLDAGDTGREGEALKLHKGLQDDDEEEDEDSFEDLLPYTPPSEVDFSFLTDESLGDDSPHKLNSLKFGGLVKPESPSSEAQNKHEQDILMTLYSSKSDRPATPKEPGDNMEDEGDFEPAEPETPFGEPNDTTRQREKEYMARQARPQSSMPTRTDLAAQIQALTAAQIPQQSTPGIAPELQRVLNTLSQPNPSTPPPQATPAAGMNFHAILQTLQQAQQQMPGQNQQLPYQAAAPIPALSSNISAMLASMQQTPQPSTAALAVGSGGNPNPYPSSYDDASSRKHGRTDSNDNDSDYGKKGGNKKKKGGFSSDQSKPYNYKTQMCSFWEQGKCLKGDACTYRHGDE